MSDNRDGLRASDADREFVAERLRTALAEGRLDLTEYDDRLKDAYAARTYGDLRHLLTDLPATTPVSGSQVVPAVPAGAVQPVQAAPGYLGAWLANVWGGYFSLAVLLTVIWFVFGRDGNYWPEWPLGILGALNLMRTITGLASGEPRRHGEKEARKRLAKEQRRALEQQERILGTTPPKTRD